MIKVLLLRASCGIFEIAQATSPQQPVEVILKHIKFVILYSSKLAENDITAQQIHRILTDFMRGIGVTRLAAQRDQITMAI